MKYFQRSLPIIICSCFLLINFRVNGHGYMVTPKSRNLLHNGGSYGPGDIASLYAGGVNYEKVNGHGICGDYLPRNEFEAPNLYGPSFPTVATYIQGQTIDINITLTAHHWGWFEFRLCRNNDGGLDITLPTTQDCLNQNILEFDYAYTSSSYQGKMRTGSGIQSPADYVGNPSFYSWQHSTCPYKSYVPAGSCCKNGGTCSPPGNNTQRWVIPDPALAGTIYTMKYKLPAAISCPRCVLQWYYQTGNSPDGDTEGFWNCADITITPSNSTVPTTIAPSSIPTSNSGLESSKAPSSMQLTTSPSTSSIVPSSKSPTAGPSVVVTPISTTAGSDTVVTLCGSNAFICPGGSLYPQQPVIPGCSVASGGFCCCNWGYISYTGSTCGCQLPGPSYSPSTRAILTNPPTVRPSLQQSTSFSTTLSPTSRGSSFRPSIITSPTSIIPTVKPTRSFAPTRKPSPVPSRRSSNAPSSSSTTASSKSPTKGASLIPTSSSKAPSSVQLTTSPSTSSIAPSSKSPTAVPSVVVTPISTTAGSVTVVTLCGSNAFICPGGSLFPQQPAIPGCSVASGGFCCCNWGYVPYSSTCGCQLPGPVMNPTLSPSVPTIGSSSTNAPTATSTGTFNGTVPVVAYRGLYKWTWSGASSIIPLNTNLAVAFSGWADPSRALSDSLSVYSNLVGLKFISIGGGNSNGYLTSQVLNQLNNLMTTGSFSAYDGICYDIEEGDSGLAGAFSTSFAIAKSKGLKVLVTVSHSAPYGIGDKIQLMSSFFTNPNIDILSPQLYTSGYETSNDYSFSGVPWSSYANAVAAVVPSLVSASMLADAQAFFLDNSRSGTSFAIQGYIQWKQS